MISPKWAQTPGCGSWTVRASHDSRTWWPLLPLLCSLLLAPCASVFLPVKWDDEDSTHLERILTNNELYRQTLPQRNRHQTVAISLRRMRRTKPA